MVIIFIVYNYPIRKNLYFNNMIKIFYDTETTGTDPRKHSIIQLAGLIERDEQIIEEFDIKLRPHPKARIEPEALHINQKTREEIFAYPPMEEGLLKFKEILNKYVDKYDRKDKAKLVGYNNRSFDDIFLRMLFDLCGDRFWGSWFWTDTLDVLVLASEYLEERRRIEMPSFKLKRVAKELGIVFDEEGMHDALFDAKLTRKIYRIVTNREIEI